MTIIAATREDEKSILIGADSASVDSETGFRRTVDNKLQRHPRAPIAWGISGSPYLGLNQFSRILQVCDPPKSWEELIQQSRKILGNIMRGEVQFAHLVYSVPTLTLDVLLVGWIDDQPGILSLWHDSPPELVDGGFRAIGKDTTALCLAHQILERSATVSNLEKFTLLIEEAADSIDRCARPIHIWRIKQDGIEIIS